MSDPYLGEIKVISFNFPPRGWAFCNGQSMPINQNQALYSVLGTQYGGDGITTFMLPNLQGRTAIHQGQGYQVGTAGGEAAHTLTINELPRHTHQAMGQSAVSSPGVSPAGSVWAGVSNADLFAAIPAGQMSPNAIGMAGANQPHQNTPPFLALNYVIALQGIFPSRN